MLESPETPGGCWTHYSSIKTPVLRREGTVEISEYKVRAVGDVVELEWEAGWQGGFDFRAPAVKRPPRQ